MLRFISVSMRNFLSYGNAPTVVDLSRPGSTLIVGQDLDNTAHGQGANGCGKASNVNALVKTPTDWIRMGDIQLGQLLQMPDGSSAEVVGVYPQGIRPTYKVTFSDGRSTNVDGEHLWSVSSHRWGNQKTKGEKILTTVDVMKYVEEANDKKKAWYNISVPTIQHPTIVDVNLPIDPYLLGVLLGDGMISQQHILISSADQHIIDKCSALLTEYHNQELAIAGEGTYNSGYDWTVVNCKRRSRGNDIHDSLINLKLHGTKSNTKFIPTCYMEGTSKSQKLALLSGLMDTDGTVGKTKGVSYCSVSKQLAEDVQYLIRSLGGKATISERHPHYTNTSGDRVAGQLAYEVRIQYGSPRELFTLDRKLDRLSVDDTQYARAGLRVTAVEQVADSECQCIMVDHPDHLYITDDFIVTHNTVLINALAYAIYDKPVSKITSKDLLVNNINKKNMFVTVTFTDDKDEYEIIRARKVKGGNNVESGSWVKLLKNGADVTPDSASNTNELIQRIIGLPYELFVRIVVFSATNTPFLDLPTKAAVDVIEELFGLTTVTDRANTLKDLIKETQFEADKIQIKIDAHEGEHKRHTNQVDSARQRVINWQVKQDQDVATLEDTIKALDGFDIDLEAEQALHNEIAELTATIKTLKSERSILAKDVQSTTNERNKLEAENLQLENATCPYCSQEFKDSLIKLKSNKEQLTQLNARYDDLTDVVLTLHEEIENSEIQLTNLSNQTQVSNIAQLIKSKSEGDAKKQMLQSMKAAGNPFVEPLEELESVVLDDINYSELNNLRKQVDHQKFILKLLTRKDSFVRRSLLNKRLPFMNKQLQAYLKVLGLPHTVEFTPELTAKISSFGRELEFGNLSNGQRARMNIALSFAFRDVLQKTHTSINVCMLDEVLDVGLDAVGVTAAANMLRRKATDEGTSMFVISHRDEISNAFDNRLTVQMEKGFSYVIQE